MSVATAIELTTVKVKVKGLTPVIFQGKGLMKLEASGNGAKKANKKYLPPEEEAVHRAHWIGKGKSRQLAIPSVMFYRSLCQAAGDFKDPRKKARALTYLFGSTISIEEDMVPLGTADFETYVDWVKIPPRTGAMVEIGRPKLPKWACAFTLLVDDEAFKIGLVHEVLTHAGRNVGIGANRPGLKGSNGKYAVTAFDVQK